MLLRRASFISFFMLMVSTTVLSFAPTADALALRSGTLSNNYTTNAGAWFLHTGSGRRTFTQHVEFQQPFANVPTVLVSLSGVDASRGANLRLEIYAKNVTRYGFDLEYVTWSDSLIYSAKVTWMAFEL